MPDSPKRLSAILNETADVKVVPSGAAYLLWLYCTKVAGFAPEAARYIREKTGLYLSIGDQFGGNGAHFLRMNAAYPRAVLQDGLIRLKEGPADTI